MEDFGRKLILVISWLSDLKIKMEKLNFAVNVLRSRVTCLEEEQT